MKHLNAAEISEQRIRREERRVVAASVLSVLAAVAVLVLLFLVLK